MQISAVCKVIATLLLASLASQVTGSRIVLRPISQPGNDITLRLSMLSNKLGGRMIDHKASVVAHCQEVSTILANISSAFDNSADALSNFTEKLFDTQVHQMPMLLDGIIEYLKMNSGDSKYSIHKSLDRIDAILADLILEFERMDGFLSESLDEMRLLESFYLEQEYISVSQNSKSLYKYPGRLASTSTVEEEENLRAILTHIVEEEHVFSDFPASHSRSFPGAITHLQYNTTFNATLLRGKAVIEYKCSGFAQVNPIQIATTHLYIPLKYKIGMDCERSISPANKQIGSITYAKGVTFIIGQSPIDVSSPSQPTTTMNSLY